MDGFEIVGEAPSMEVDDVMATDEQINRYDMVTFERIGPGRMALRVVKPKDYADFSGTIYQIDRGQQIGTFQLRQVQMRFWPR